MGQELLPQLCLTHRQNRRQEVVNRGAFRLCGGALRSCREDCHSNLTKIPLTDSVSYFNLGGLGALFGGLTPPRPPMATGLHTNDAFGHVWF